MTALRVVLAVALAAALLGAVAPALEDARTTRTERLAARELGRVESAAQTLVREEAPGARRTLRISFPDDSPTAAPLAFVALGGVPGDDVHGEQREAATDTAEGDVLAYRIAGGTLGVRRIDTDLRVVRDGTRIESDSRALVLRGGGTYHLTLRLVRNRGQSSVTVRVRDQSSVAVRIREPPSRGTAPPPPRDKPPPGA